MASCCPRELIGIAERSVLAPKWIRMSTTNYNRRDNRNRSGADNSDLSSPADLRQLVRATSQLQEQVRSAVQRLEQSTSSSGSTFSDRSQTGTELHRAGGSGTMRNDAAMGG